jgi:catechol 2,3-dioxygenase-like lactoylglutathione lyase family enzyme
MLQQETLVAFMTTDDPAAARRFYEGVLGLTFEHEHEHLIVFRSGPTLVSLQKAESVTPPRGTAMGWDVRDLRGEIRSLTARGVVFERFEGMDQDDLGVWSPAPGTGVAWFKDPSGNLLSLSQANS